MEDFLENTFTTLILNLFLMGLLKIFKLVVGIHTRYGAWEIVIIVGDLVQNL
jgi:hypothetical protein